MRIKNTKFKDIKIIELEKKIDSRGYFAEIFSLRNKFNFDIKQINASLSKKVNTFRGLHYQKGVSAQAKIIGVMKGEIIDYIFCLKKGDKNFGKILKIKIKENQMKLVYIPKGYAHGFLTKKKNTLILYFVNKLYNKKSEDGISPLDNQLKLNLPSKIIMSKKDRKLNIFNKNKSYFL